MESGGADDGNEHGVSLGEAGEIGESGEAGVKGGAGGEGTGGAGGGESGIVVEAYVGDAESVGDGGEFFPIAARGDGDEFEFVGVRGDDAQGVFADGAGGAEEDDACAGGNSDRLGHRSRSLTRSLDGSRAEENE